MRKALRDERDASARCIVVKKVLNLDALEAAVKKEITGINRLTHQFLRV